MDKNNIWSKAKHLDDKRKTLLIKQGKKLLEFCLDTKNLLLNREAVIKNNIIFDHRYSVLGCGYEDIDLGTQILEKGLGGKLNSKLIVDHHDPNSFLGIVNTRLRWGALYPLYKQKWTVLLDKYALPLNNQITTSNSLANLFRYLFLYIFSIKKIYLNKFSKTLVFLTISFSLKIGEILSKPIIEFMNLKNSSIPTFSSKEP